MERVDALEDSVGIIATKWLKNQANRTLWLRASQV